MCSKRNSGVAPQSSASLFTFKTSGEIMANRTLIENSILPLVAKPNRYIGNFVEARPERFSEARLRAVIILPDVFEAGLSDRLTRSAHTVLNAVPGVFADLAFLPWSDLADLLKQRGVPLWGLETFHPLAGFDLILFTPSSVFHYVPMLRVLELAGIPLLASERGHDAPLVAAIGPVLLNPAPLADFLDLVLLGEPEAALPAVACRLAGEPGRSRAERLLGLEGLAGTWIPGRTTGPVRPAVVGLSRVVPPEPALLPLVETGHEGLGIEIRRGGAPFRFEGGWRSFAPAWEMPIEMAIDRAEQGLARTGFDRIDFGGDLPVRHRDILFLTESLIRRHPGVRVHVPDFGTAEPRPALAREILRGRRSTFLWSPLVATARLNRVLNYDFDEAAFLEAVSVALRGGCHLARFRFGIGWPTETDEDLRAIGTLMKRVRGLVPAGTAPPRYQVSLEPFVPRPHSPLQWEAQVSPAELVRRIELVRKDVEHGPVQLRTAPPEEALVGVVLSRGGPELGPALVLALKAGASAPNLSETWNSTRWLEPFATAGVDLDKAIRPLDPGAALPWDGIEAGLPRDILLEERLKALEAETTSPQNLHAAARAVVCEIEPMEFVTAPAEAPRASSESAFGRSSRRRGAPGAPRQASRFRLRFAKGDLVRFTAHLDVTRAFERAIRRLGSSPGTMRGRGFKLSFGPPLPLGMTGDDEYLDLTFTDDVPETALLPLGDFLPQGLRLLDTRPVRASVESLCHAIDTAIYQVTFPEPLAAFLAPGGADFLAQKLEMNVVRALSLHEILVPKTPDDEINRIDARPTLLAARVEREADGAVALNLHLAIGMPGNLRPEALLPALTGGGFDPRLARIHRQALRISGAGKDFPPLEVVELDFPWWRETLRKRAGGQRS
jgi:radical SAM-linked protein